MYNTPYCVMNDICSVKKSEIKIRKYTYAKYLLYAGSNLKPRFSGNTIH